MRNRDDDVEQTFRLNKDLINMSPRNLAIYFHIQGELASSHTREVNRQMARFYRNRLGQLSVDAMNDADKEWMEQTKQSSILEAVE